MNASNQWQSLGLRLAGVVLALTVSSPVSQAQSIVGKISDSAKRPIPNARVVLESAETHQLVSAVTGKDGLFSVSKLTAGKYSLVISAAGFSEVHQIVTVNSLQSIRLSINMVSGSGPQKDQVGRNQTNSTNISDLPLNGRSASDVATLEPGVATARTQTSGEAQRGFGTQMTISGSRPRQNDSRLDGISVNDYSNGPPGSALGVNLGVDAVEQFSVLSSNYPAQYGRSSGGIVSASTRSATNSFHGDVYEFLRNSVLDARNYFDQAKPPFRRNQFGVSLGGPIRPDRTFIFGDYEGLRQSLGLTQVDTVPSAAARAGDLSTGRVSVDPMSLRFINAFYPLPNGSALGAGDTAIYSFAGQQITPENYFTTKVDHNLSKSDALSGTYMFDSSTVRQPDNFNDTRTGYDARRQVVTLHESHSAGTGFVNSFLFGINRVVARTGLTFPSGNASAADPSFGTVPGRNAAGVSVPGLTAFNGGLGALSTYNFHWTSIQAYDDIILTRGNHSLKFGFGIERMRDNIVAVSDPGGVFSFNSLSDFLTNTPFFLSAPLPTSLSARGLRDTIASTYIQEDWRWRPTFTLNLGMRYEMSSVPTEAHGQLTVLRHLTDAAPHLGDPLFDNPTLHNFEPRVGFSWNPTGNGKTLLSSGFGIFDVLPLPYLIQTNELFSAPFSQQGNTTNLPPGSFPGQAFNFIASSPNTFRQAYFDPHPGRNYVIQWNVTIQQELAKSLSALVGYVGSRGVHQPFRVEDADIVMPVSTPKGYLWPAPPGSGTRLNLNSGRITAGFWNGNSYYDALQVQVKKTIGRSSHLNGSYTWGKSIDTGSGSMVGDEYSNSIGSPLWFNPRLNRGLSDFNVAHNLEINYTWEVPAPGWDLRAFNWALTGWQLGGVFEASTGVPFTPILGGDALGLKSTDPNIDVPNLIGGPGCGSLVNSGDPVHYIRTQCFSVPNPITLRGDLGRNTLIGPGLVNFDFSLFKNNYIKRISDHFNAQFRAEFFNVLNHPNFAPPLDNKNLFDSTGQPVANAGLITSTQTPSRQIQFALKLIW
ncbi:MAG TPA: carboxypeptidase regulatory-like domain-containing protein [Terriglobales bacterium]